MVPNRTQLIPVDTGSAEKTTQKDLKGEQVARRVLRLLNYVGQKGSNLTAKAIARDLGVSLATAYHLINSLIQEGYVERVPGSKGYRLGPMISLLYQRSLGIGDLVSDVEPVLDELAERTGQRIYLAIYSDGEVTVVEKKCAPGSAKMPDEGFRRAEHALALGKVLLANAPDGDLESYKDHASLESFTKRTITDAYDLQLCLNQVRCEGFATDLEEFSSGFCCIAAPVHSAAGDVEAAIGLSAPSRRFRVEAKSFAHMILRAGQEASAIRGYRQECTAKVSAREEREYS